MTTATLGSTALGTDTVTIRHTSPACPECAGLRLPRHPAGLVHRHSITCRLLAAEDATKAADRERLTDLYETTRAMTTTEAVLLRALGHVLTTPPPPTIVTRITGGRGVINRAWPGITLDTPVPAP